jgi:hypothetical protein
MDLSSRHAERDAAVIWVDAWHAIVARHRAGLPTIIEMDRAADPESLFLHRVAQEADDCDRLMIIGPDPTCHAFEHEYVALHRRVDRALDVEVAASVTRAALIDRLRLLEGASPSAARPPTAPTVNRRIG